MSRIPRFVSAALAALLAPAALASCSGSAESGSHNANIPLTSSDAAALRLRGELTLKRSRTAAAGLFVRRRFFVDIARAI